MRFHLRIEQDGEERCEVTAHERSALTDAIEALVLSYQSDGTLTVYNEDGVARLAYDAIACVTVMDRRSYVIASDGRRYRIRAKLYEVEARLPSYFLRINKSTVANPHEIARFASSFSGAVDAVFRCGYKDYVSRRCFADIKRRFHL